MILEGGVLQYSSAERLPLARWQHHAQRGLDIKTAIAFAACDGGRNHRSMLPIRPGRETGPQERRHHVVAVSFVGRHQPIFRRNRKITETIEFLTWLDEVHHVNSKLGVNACFESCFVRPNLGIIGW